MTAPDHAGGRALHRALPSSMCSLTTPGLAGLLKLIKHDALRRFAGENYFCAEHLLQLFTLEGQHIDKHDDQYPLGRATVALIGGVLESICSTGFPPSGAGLLEAC